MRYGNDLPADPLARDGIVYATTMYDTSFIMD